MAFVSGLMFMCGRRVYRPIGGEQSSTYQMSSIGGTSNINVSALGTQATPTAMAKNGLSQSRNIYTVK